MSHITKLKIKNYRGLKELTQNFDTEKFVILIGRGDSGKSTILSAINAALSPSWNMVFSDLDFYNQDTSQSIEIELSIKELPIELLRESKFGMYVQNDLSESIEQKDLYIIIKLSVDAALEPHWVVKARENTNIEDKTISGVDRALLAMNYITDYTDNQFAYNKQSPLYALTKANLDDGNTIERVKSNLIRSMATAIKPEQLQALNTPLENLIKTAQKLGLGVDDLCAHIDIKDNPYTGNSIALYNESLPYRLHGKGSKRLMSIAIQTELTKQGGIVLVDEIEQGLEPDRIITLVRILKETTNGQVFITTHSLNVVLEAEWHNLYIVNRHSKELSMLNEELNPCRRSNPQILFSKKIICCEGKTEIGFIRAVDSWIKDKFNTSLSANGVVVLDAKGGSNMFTFACKLKEIGFDTCIFADDDNSKELKSYKEDARENGVEMFLCESGNCLERQVLIDLPWKYIPEILECSQTGFPYLNIQISDELKVKVNNLVDEQKQKETRDEIFALCITKKKEWFKHIPGGEFLGRLVTKSYEDMNEDKSLKQTLTSLLRWCNINI